MMSFSELKKRYWLLGGKRKRKFKREFSKKVRKQAQEEIQEEVIDIIKFKGR